MTTVVGEFDDLALDRVRPWRPSPIARRILAAVASVTKLAACSEEPASIDREHGATVFELDHPETDEDLPWEVTEGS